MKKLTAILLVLSAFSTAKAATFIPQASFNVTGSNVVGMDRDAGGNLYVLASAAGAPVVPGNPSLYTVTSYQTPSMTPELSFSVSITTPLAFAVEANGTVDIVDAGNGLTLSRFNNAGTLLSQASRIQPYGANYYTGAIDKANSAFYVSYKNSVIQATGDFSFKILYYVGAVTKYSFSGQAQSTFDLPGRTTISTTCYTPSMMTVDDQSTLWIGDPVCNQVFAYNSQGAQTQDISLPYAFFPRSLWTGPGENIFIAHAICNSYDCSQGQVVEFNSSGVQQYTGTTTSIMGEAWDSRILYMASPSGGSLQRFILDTAPTAPVPSSPQGVVSQHSAMATMSWQTANDAEGDPLLYSVYIGPSPSQLSFAGSTSQNNFTSAALSFGTNYYWQVTAQDSYLGLPMLTSNSSIVGFGLSFTNNSPGGFTPTAGMGTAITRSASVTFGWTAAIDPDGDPVTYTVSWQPAGQSAATVVTTAANSLTVTGLTFGTNVNWSVKACDPYAACTPMAGGTQVYLPVFQNSPPPAPAITGGTGVIAEHTMTPGATLTWGNSIDPDGDPVAYRLYIGAAPGAMALVQDGSQTSYALGSMSFGTNYYWQVSAYDPYGGIGTTQVQSLLVQLQNNPPQPFAVLTGTGTLPTRGTSQLLSWAAAVDPDGDGVTYEVDLSTNPAALAAVQTSTSTGYNLSFQLGTTYYWQVIARDGFGGAASSGLQSLFPVFRNSPPTVPANQSKAGTILYHGFAPSESFFWQASTDPDGDPFTYSLSYGTDSSHMVVVSSAPLGYTLSNLPLNQAIYYQIVATDIYGAGSPSPVNWVYFQLTNTPPGPFDVVGTTGTILTRQTSVNLSWTPSIDPDGDPISYGVLVGTAPSALALLTNTTKTSALLSSLAFGTTYYWQVFATDSFGARTDGALQTFLPIFENTPPPAPAILQSTGTLLEHALGAQVPLSWSAVQDPDGDPINYLLYLGSSTSSLAAVQSSTQTSFLIANAIFGATYYWQVSAQNPYGGASTTTIQAATPVFLNNPPGSFAVTLGTGTLTTRTTTQVLTWTASADPDGDPVTYALSVSTNPARMAAVQTSTATSFSLAFAFGTTYYWTVSAFDGFGGTTTISGGTQSLMPVFLNQAPQVVQLMAPFNGAPVISTMRGNVSVSWNQVTTPQNDPVTYTVYLGNSVGGAQPLIQIGQTTQLGATSLALRPMTVTPQATVQTDGNTITLNLSGLDYYRTYYIQIQASNPYGATSVTPFETFSLASANGFPTAYNYPNPFSSVRGGTNIVFNAPASGYARATVSVYSEMGDLLSKTDYANIPPGISQQPLNGRDRYGRALFNGSYICRVKFEGPDDHATFYLLVVK